MTFSFAATFYSGGTEATGPHVALGKHNFRVRSYAQRIADSLGNALIAPILPFAPNSEALQKWPGTFTLDSLTFSKVNEQIAMSMISSGFRHVIFPSDHLNSQAPLAALARKLDSMYHAQGIDVYYAADGYVKARTQIEGYIEKQQMVPGGHGGLWDVSETMAISKVYVRPEFFAIRHDLSSIRFNFKFVTGETMRGNFSTITLLVSRPKPRSSDRLMSFNQK